MSIYIDDLIPEGAETGVGLALRDRQGRYLFFLAGTKFDCPPGELFYAGIGGHVEEGESWVECAHREAIEEIGADIELLSADNTWIVSSSGETGQVAVFDQPRPFALYRMAHLEGSPRAGDTYHIVIYSSALREPPGEMPIEEIRGVIALTREQVVKGPNRRPSLSELISEGAEVIATAKSLDFDTVVYPIGTAAALASVLGNIADSIAC